MHHLAELRKKYEAQLHWLVEQRRKFYNTVLLLFSHRKKFMIVNGSFKQNGWEVIPTNFGDDLNAFLLERLTGKRIMNCHEFFHVFQPRNYMVIGSVLDWKANDETVVWGSGIISKNNLLQKKPRVIAAVRGEFTRRALLDQGISCPSVYGDPALLLPFVYDKKVEKKHKIGIIPHYVDLYGEVVRSIVDDWDDVVLIDVQRYSSITDFIDSVRSCEFVVSSSLHGLIISDVFDIPNAWVKFSDKIIGGDFKFYDYFSAVNRSSSPYVVSKKTKADDVMALIQRYKKIEFDPLALLSACPFKIINSVLNGGYGQE